MNSICFLASLFLAVTVFTSDVTAQDTVRAPAQNLLVFYAMGDVPYTAEQEIFLREQIASLPRDGSFVIHLGDIKAGAPPCDEAVYVKVAEILNDCRSPLFIIPGDNEWNDCVDPIQGWSYWKQHFLRFDQRWQHQLPVFRQLEREENFSFVTGNVLFIGINIVGGVVHDADEWSMRHRQNLQWVRRNMSQFGSEVSSLIVFGHANPVDKHADFFAPFSQDAKDFGKPILYLHGDGHRWIQDRPFAAKNILRVQVDQGGIAPPIKVTVTDDAIQPFEIDRRN